MTTITRRMKVVGYEACLAYDALAYFEKPYKAQDLMHAVQGVLGE